MTGIRLDKSMILAKKETEQSKKVDIQKADLTNNRQKAIPREKSS